MDNLTAGTAGSRAESPKEARPRVSYPAPRPGSGVRHRAKRVSEMLRNRCPTSAETGVRLGAKYAAATLRSGLADKLQCANLILQTPPTG